MVRVMLPGSVVVDAVIAVVVVVGVTVVLLVVVEGVNVVVLETVIDEVVAVDVVFVVVVTVTTVVVVGIVAVELVVVAVVVLVLIVGAAVVVDPTAMEVVGRLVGAVASWRQVGCAVGPSGPPCVMGRWSWMSGSLQTSSSGWRSPLRCVARLARPGVATGPACAHWRVRRATSW